LNTFITRKKGSKRKKGVGDGTSGTEGAGQGGNKSGGVTTARRALNSWTEGIKTSSTAKNKRGLSPSEEKRAIFSLLKKGEPRGKKPGQNFPGHTAEKMHKFRITGLKGRNHPCKKV